jgi:hypothetical protein
VDCASCEVTFGDDVDFKVVTIVTCKTPNSTFAKKQNKPKPTREEKKKQKETLNSFL